MAEPEEIERAVSRNIKLHKLLKDLVRKEKELFGENNLEGRAQEAKLREQVEAEIVKATSDIQVLFESIEREKVNFTENQKQNLSVLMNRLRETITETIGVVEQTRRDLKHMKNETFDEIKTYAKTRNALKIYGRINQ